MSTLSANDPPAQRPKQSRIRRASKFASLLGLAAPALVGIPEAGASNYSGATGSQADCDNNNVGSANESDNSTWAWYYHSITSEMKTALDWNESNNYEPTDLTVIIQTSSQYGGDTDINAYDQNYTTFCRLDWDNSTENIVGDTFCWDANNGIFENQKCNRHEIRFDTSDVLDSSWTTANRKSLACHELGHAVGLLHRDSSEHYCMEVGVFGAKEYLTSHDVAHINNNY